MAKLPPTTSFCYCKDHFPFEPHKGKSIVDFVKELSSLGKKEVVGEVG